MRMYDLITKTRDGIELSREEIQFIISGYTAGSIPDYQMAAWCMAIYFKGLSPTATAALTMAMVESGETLTWPELDGVVVDKHSTGGVGDKTTLVLLPWVAATGCKIAKMSGRGLGHTGGTLDKLDAIDGFESALDRGRFIEQVQAIDLAVAGQTGALVPADQKLYALRDVTATVDSIPLIASSIMSKKIAAGAEGIVLDVKVGKGAFMQELPLAKQLAETMVDIGKHTQRQTSALITNMDQPLGHAVGNALEVKEAIQTLKGEGPEDLSNLCLALGAEMLLKARRVSSLEAGRKLLEDTMQTGQPLHKLKQMIAHQGGSPEVVDNPDLLPKAPVVRDVKAVQAAYVKEVNARSVGLIAMQLGAGRQTIDDTIDLTAGIEIFAKVGRQLQAGDIIARLHGQTEQDVDEAVMALKDAISWSPTPTAEPQLILGRISS
ncbi:MAG: pyrimidine-nucleoside phosphorylase [Firmicutes bacterium]|nr:pyrimidine-nucleoside phosphorylase [Bacillota bacterium]